MPLNKAVRERCVNLEVWTGLRVERDANRFEPLGVGGVLLSHLVLGFPALLTLEAVAMALLFEHRVDVQIVVHVAPRVLPTGHRGGVLHQSELVDSAGLQSGHHQYGLDADSTHERDMWATCP